MITEGTGCPVRCAAARTQKRVGGGGREGGGVRGVGPVRLGGTRESYVLDLGHRRVLLGVEIHHLHLPVVQ